MSLGAALLEKHIAGLYSLHDEPMAAPEVRKMFDNTPYFGEVDSE
jgi:hypothetical protein